MFPTAAAVANAEAFLPNVDGVNSFTETHGKALSNSISRALLSNYNMATVHFESSGLDRGR